MTSKLVLFLPFMRWMRLVNKDTLRADFFACAPSPASIADQMHAGLQRFIEALWPYRQLSNARAQVNPLDEVIDHAFG